MWKNVGMMTHLKCLQNNDKIRLVLCLFCLILRRIFNHTIVNTWPWGMYCMIFDNIYCIIHQSLIKSQNYSRKFVNVSESPNSHFPVISVTLCMLLLFTFVKQWGTTLHQYLPLSYITTSIPFKCWLTSSNKSNISSEKDWIVWFCGQFYFKVRPDVVIHTNLLLELFHILEVYILKTISSS